MEPAKKLRIAFFMHDLSGGGVERMRLRLMAELAARGNAVSLVVLQSAGGLREFVPSSVSLFELGRMGSVRAAWILARWLRVHRVDVLVSSLDHNNIAALVARCLIGGATRIVICQHNALSAERVLGWRYRLVPPLYHIFSHRADAILAVSSGVAADLARIAHIRRNRISVVYNPVVDEVPPIPSPALPPHIWFTDHNIPIFLFVGRLVAQKDPLLLLEAFAVRLRQGPARLILLGEGPMQFALRRHAAALHISRHVQFCGFVSDPKVWMRHSAALILTSRYEGFGNVLVEAMACGTPTIATDCPFGPSEILARGRFGRLVPVGNVGALAAAMAEDLRAAFPAEQLMARAACFSVKRCADEHESIFAAITASRRGRAFGLRFCVLDAVRLAELIIHTPAVDHVRLVVTPNLDHIRLLQRATFAAAYRAAEIVCADGFPVAIYAWLRGAGPPRRLTGCDIFHHLAADAVRLPRRVLVVVESAATGNAVFEWIERRGLQSSWHVQVAVQRLLSSSDAQLELVAAANAVRPDIMVLTLGAPVSEEFAYLNAKALPPCWVICVGQAVRIELGLIRRAPALLRYCGLEWAWRLRQEPARLAGRYLRALIWFPRAVMADMRGREH